MKNYELLEIMQGLDKATSLETSVPVAEGYKIVCNKKTIKDALVAFEEMRNAIVKKYADGNGEVKEENPNYQTCLKEVNELANQECDELTFKKIKLATIEKLELPLNTIQSIFFMIDDSTD